MATESMKNPMFDIFKTPLIKDAIDSSELLEYAERNVNLATAPNFTLINQDLDIFSWMFHSYLEVAIVLLKDDAENTVFADGALIAPVNGGWSWFRQVQLFMNDQHIETIQFPGITQTVLNLTNKSPSWAENSGELEFWYADTNLGDPFNENLGFNSRRIRSEGGRQVVAKLALKSMFGFIDANRIVFRGIKWTIKLIRESNDNIIHRTQISGLVTNPGVIQFKKLSLWINAIQPNPEIEAAINLATTSKTEAGMLWTQLEMIQSPLFTFNVQVINQRITLTQGIPTRIYIMGSRAAREGNQEETLMTFDNLDFETVQIRLNNVPVPIEEIRSNFGQIRIQDNGGELFKGARGAENFCRPHLELLRAEKHYLDDDDGGIVNYEDFKRLYPIFLIEFKTKKQIFAAVQTFELELRLRLRSNSQRTDGAIANGAVENADFFIYTLVESMRQSRVVGVNQRVRIDI